MLGSFAFITNYVKSLLENKIFQTRLYRICTSKTIKKYQNQHVDFLRLFFTENSLKIKWDLDVDFFDKIFSIIILQKQTCQVSLKDSIYFLSYSVKYISSFMLTHLIPPLNLTFYDSKIPTL